MRTPRLHALLLAALLAAGGLGSPAAAQVVAPPFDTAYSVTNLGSVPGVPLRYGGLTFAPGDPDTLLIGGNANTLQGGIWSIGLVRDAAGRITGFSGTAAFVADADGTVGGIDGGLAYGPDGVLFYTSYPDNRLGQILPGGTGPAKLIDLDAAHIGIAGSVGTLAFVPPGFPGAGRLKIAQFSNLGHWYDVVLAPDGSGTFDVVEATHRATIGGGPEGVVYVAAGSPHFTVPSVLVTEYDSSRVSTYEVDAAGDPIPATRRTFVDFLPGAEGAVVDPVTGDFLFSTFGASNQVLVVRGFAPPAPSIPLDAFLCYKARVASGAPAWPAAPVALADDLETAAATAGKPVALCNPASVDGGATVDPAIHLAGRTLAQPVRHQRLRGLPVQTALGALSLDTIKPDRLLVPGAQDEHGPVEAPDPAGHEVDPFKCYKARVTPGTPRLPRGLRVSIGDGFGEEKVFAVKKPVRLCAAAGVGGAPSKHPEWRLVCYRVKRAPGEPKHARRTSIHVNSALFGPGRLDTVAEAELCLPAAGPAGP